VPLLISTDDSARYALYATAAAAVVGEVAATYLGQARSERPAGVLGKLQLLGSSLQQTTLFRSRGGPSADRGTKQFLVICALAGLGVAIFVAANFPSLRFGANVWGTLALGLGLAWLGILLRIWSVWSLGRFFQRDVMIQEGHVVHRSGPYRQVRHPAYAGNLLTYFGIGLAIGSWVGALACLVISFVGHIPRIRVEEQELTRALGDSYRDYAGATDRLVPGVW
jgi:protein-S-isoprenylcysteine O-methyltransferase Ste14